MSREGLGNADVVHDRRWWILGVLCVSLLVIALDNTVLNVALPTLARPTRLGGLGATESQLQWVIDGYTIVFAGLLLTAGSLGDRFGRYAALSLGLALFGAASATASQASSPAMLITLRCVMGIGGALIMPSTLSILTNVFRDPIERGRAIGVWAGVAAIGVGLGPVTGGFLLAHFWWGSVLMINVPIVIAGLVAGYFLIPDSKDPSAPRLDPVGSVGSLLGLSALLWAIIEEPSHGWSSPGVVAGFATGFVVLGAFMVWELNCSHPMLNVQFFANPRFSVASVAITLTFFALFGMVFLLTQYLQAVLGYSPLEAGALLIPMGASLVVAAPAAARFAEWFGTKVVVGGGLVIVAVALACMATLGVHSGPSAIVGITVILGIGMGNVMAPATESIMGSLPPAKAGVGSAVNDTTRQVGGAVGVAVLGSLLSAEYRSQVSRRASLTTTHDVVAGARDNIQHALAIAAHAPAGIGATLAANARLSFVDGFHIATVTGAVVALIAAAVVVAWLPAHAGRDAAAPATEPTTTGAAEPPYVHEAS